MKKVIWVGMVAMGMSLAACSADVSGGSGPGNPLPGLTKVQSKTPSGFVDPKPSITGVSLDGQWISDCEKRGPGFYRRLEVDAKGENIVRFEHQFSDSGCQDLSNDQKQTGRFRFLEAHADGSFIVEYSFVAGHGAFACPQEQIAVKDNTLYLSDMSVSSGSLMFGVPLYKQ